MRSEAPFRVLALLSDETDTEAAIAVFEETGVAFTIAQSPEEALSAAEANPPHVLLIDITLPERRGLELVRDLKTAPETRDALALLVSTRSGGCFRPRRPRARPRDAARFARELRSVCARCAPEWRAAARAPRGRDGFSGVDRLPPARRLPELLDRVARDFGITASVVLRDPSRPGALTSHASAHWTGERPQSLDTLPVLDGAAVERLPAGNDGELQLVVAAPLLRDGQLLGTIRLHVASHPEARDVAELAAVAESLAKTL
jgi:CheY-like chemotaxis protein